MVSSDTKVKGVSFPFWLWPNVLSLDAPCVAVCWQRALGNSAGISIAASESVALAVAVWSVYVLDRVLDGPAECSARHLFAAAHRKTLLWTLAVVDLAAGIFVLPTLRWHVLVGGLAIAAACAAYLIASQNVIRAKSSKAFTMSLLFSAGVVLPLAYSSVTLPFLATAFVVWVNTQLIRCWERALRASALERVLLLCAGLVLVGIGTRYLEALALGCWLMLFLDVTEDRMNVDLRGSLADAVLILAVIVAG